MEIIGLSAGRRKGKKGGERCREEEAQIGSHKIDRRMLRTIQEMEKPKDLYA